jgi:hypothetical protein
MSGYIGSKASVTLVDGYTQAEADAEFVDKAGDTMTGGLTVGGTVTATDFAGDGSNLTGISTGLSSLTSGDNTWAAGGTYTLSHSLGTMPKAIQIELVCIVANNGYSVGDIHVLSSGERYANWGVALIDVTSSTIKWGIYNAGIVFRNESNTTSASRSTSQWRIRLTLIG